MILNVKNTFWCRALIIKEKSLKSLMWDYEKLLNGLVRESGKWSKRVIDELKENDINIYRNNHIGSGINNIISKIMMLE